MVDENRSMDRFGVLPSLVQIPLWSMKTILPDWKSHPSEEVQIPLWSMKTFPPFFCTFFFSCSDSSMVDENPGGGENSKNSIKFRFLYGRWKRGDKTQEEVAKACSDSSMVDENAYAGIDYSTFRRVQIPLWSMKTYLITPPYCVNSCSDSSMVDENPSAILSALSLSSFRFLYGRWKPRQHPIDVRR